MAKIKKVILDNGLKVITEYTKKDCKVAFLVGIKAGSIDETARVNGGSHFNEHMLFKSNSNRSAEEITQDLEWNGIKTNAFTSENITLFYTYSLAENLPKAIEIAYQAATNLKYDGQEFKRERGVILSEIKMYTDDPFYSILLLTENELFKKTPLEKPVGGTPKSMGNVTKEELEKLKAKFYVPNNMAIIAVGGLNEKETLGTIKKTFGKMEPKDVRHPDLFEIEPANKEKKIINIKREGIDLAYLTFSYRIPGYTKNFEDSKKFDKIDDILSSGLSSRLFKELREKRGIGYAVNSYLDNFGPVAGFTIYIGGFDNKRFDEAVETIEGITKDLKKNYVGDKELKGRKTYTLSNLRDKIKKPSFRAMKLLGKEFDKYPKEYDIDKLEDYIKNVTKHDIIEVANKYLTDKPLIITYHPEKRKTE